MLEVTKKSTPTASSCTTGLQGYASQTETTAAGVNVSSEGTLAHSYSTGPVRIRVVTIEQHSLSH